jgi:hypothetical protein
MRGGRGDRSASSRSIHDRATAPSRSNRRPPEMDGVPVEADQLGEAQACWAAPGGSVSGGLEADGLRRRPECRDGVPLGGRAWLGEKCMTPSTQNHTPRLAGNPNPFACPCRFLVLSASRGSLTGLALAPATVAGVDDERRAGQSIPDLAASASAFHGVLRPMVARTRGSCHSVRPVETDLLGPPADRSTSSIVR